MLAPPVRLEFVKKEEIIEFISAYIFLSSFLLVLALKPNLSFVKAIFSAKILVSLIFCLNSFSISSTFKFNFLGKLISAFQLVCRLFISILTAFF